MSPGVNRDGEPMMLLLKLTLAPLLVVAATLAAQKWGPRVGGLLLGLPLTTSPGESGLYLHRPANDL